MNGNKLEDVIEVLRDEVNSSINLSRDEMRGAGMILVKIEKLMGVEGVSSKMQPLVSQSGRDAGHGGTLFSGGESTFEKELCHLINCFSRENGSDTPDYVLAEYMNDCLNAYEKAIRAREKDIRVVAENKVG